MSTYIKGIGPDGNEITVARKCPVCRPRVHSGGGSPSPPSAGPAGAAW